MPGQVWSYQTRKGEETSYLTILKIEEYPKAGTAIHIAVDKVNILGPQSGECYGQTISHMPFSREALDNSVTELNGKVSTLPIYEEGYRDWKEHFTNGNAGIFSISVAEAIGFIETTLDK